MLRRLERLKYGGEVRTTFRGGRGVPCRRVARWQVQQAPRARAFSFNSEQVVAAL